MELAKDHGLATVVWTRKDGVLILAFDEVVSFVLDSLLKMIGLVHRLRIFQVCLVVGRCG